MSDYEQRDNSGSLFKNDKKQQPNHADYRGSVRVDGRDYWLKAWIKKSKAGTTYMSLALDPKEDRHDTPVMDRGQGGFAPHTIDDDIPF